MWHDFISAVQRIDVAALDRDELGELAGDIGSARAVLDGLEARTAVALRRLGASEATTAETLRRRTGCSSREARHRARRAETLDQMPNVAEALSSGRLTGEHASALARAAAETSPEAVDGDAGLLAAAEAVPADLASHKTRDWTRRHQTGDDLNRLHQWQRRNRSLNFTEGHGDMLNGIAKFDRVSGAQFQALVEALADRLYRADGGRDNPNARTRTQCRLDALLALVGIEPVPRRRTAVIWVAVRLAGLGRAVVWVAVRLAGSGRAVIWVVVRLAGSGRAVVWVAVRLAGLGRAVVWVVVRLAGSGRAVVGADCVHRAFRGCPPWSEAAPRLPTGAVQMPVRSWTVWGQSTRPPRSTSRTRQQETSGTMIRRAVPASPAASRNSKREVLDPQVIAPMARPAAICRCRAAILRLGRVARTVPTARLTAGFVPARLGGSPARPFGRAAPAGGGSACEASSASWWTCPTWPATAKQGRCEIPGIGEIARSELERRACDADIYGLIFSSDGLPLNHGRKTRTVSPQQWRVLVARDRGCVICGARPDWCQAHHVKPWLRGGRTDIDNLALVCHGHHRWIHDNDITLRPTSNGWRAPPGVTVPRSLA